MQKHLFTRLAVQTAILGLSLVFAPLSAFAFTKIAREARLHIRAAILFTRLPQAAHLIVRALAAALSALSWSPGAVPARGMLTVQVAERVALWRRRAWSSALVHTRSRLVQAASVLMGRSVRITMVAIHQLAHSSRRSVAERLQILAAQAVEAIRMALISILAVRVLQAKVTMVAQL